MRLLKERFIFKKLRITNYEFKNILKQIFSDKQREIIRYWIKAFQAFFIQSNLSKLAKLYGTDKLEHGYTEIYKNFLNSIRLDKLQILEIGIGGGENTKYGGNSLKMWEQYFPNSEILGIDIFDKSLLNYRRIKTYQGNQTDFEFLAQFKNLDIIIDDGSHINSDIIQSFEFLFPRLITGGFYCIEDTQVSGIEEFHNSNYPETIQYFHHLDSEKFGKIQFFNQLIVITKN